MFVCLGVHRVKLYVMCCALVCGMLNVRVWLVCDFLCGIVWCVKMRVFACVCDCSVCCFAYVVVCCL